MLDHLLASPTQAHDIPVSRQHQSDIISATHHSKRFSKKLLQTDHAVPYTAASNHVLPPAPLVAYIIVEIKVLFVM